MTADDRWTAMWAHLKPTDDEREAANEETIAWMAEHGFGPEDEDIQAAMEIGHILGQREAR